MRPTERPRRWRPPLHQVRRWGFAVLAVDFVVLAVLGAWLAFRYQPGGGAISTAHDVLGLVAVLAALAAAIATVADASRSTVGVLPAVVILAAVSGTYLIGPLLAWEGLVVDGDVGDARGITVVFDADVGAVQQGNQQIEAGEYRSYAWLHTLGLPLAVVVMGAAGLWGTRRRTTYVPKRAARA